MRAKANGLTASHVKAGDRVTEIQPGGDRYGTVMVTGLDYAMVRWDDGRWGRRKRRSIGIVPPWETDPGLKPEHEER